MKIEEGAKNVIDSCLNVQLEEEVLIVTDEEKHNIANSFFLAALEAGAHPLLVKAKITYRHQEPVHSLAELMKIMDVIVIVTKYSLSHTKARREANRAGARIVSMPGLTKEGLTRGGLTADFYEIEKVMRKVHRRVRGGKKVIVNSKSGFEFTFSIKGRKWVTEDTGLCSIKGRFTTLPAGEIFIAPIEETAEGKFVADHSFVGLLNKPANITLREGVVTKAVGAQKAISEMNKGGREGRYLAKFGIGLNPKSEITGNILEDEKKMGTVNIGFGGNWSFGGALKSNVLVSAVIEKPTVMVDDITILDKGKLKL